MLSIYSVSSFIIKNLYVPLALLPIYILILISRKKNQLSVWDWVLVLLHPVQSFGAQIYGVFIMPAICATNSFNFRHFIGWISAVEKMEFAGAVSIFSSKSLQIILIK